MKAKNKLWEWCLRLEHHLCPDFCGVVDRRRVIAFVLLSLIEILIIPYHFILFYIMDAWIGFSYNVAHTIVLALLLYLVLARKLCLRTASPCSISLYSSNWQLTVCYVCVMVPNKTTSVY